MEAGDKTVEIILYYSTGCKGFMITITNFVLGLSSALGRGSFTTMHIKSLASILL